eukprot:1186382-Prorocentrum_minimum.AAC.5
MHVRAGRSSTCVYLSYSQSELDPAVYASRVANHVSRCVGPARQEFNLRLHAIEDTWRQRERRTIGRPVRPPAQNPKTLKP